MVEGDKAAGRRKSHLFFEFVIFHIAMVLPVLFIRGFDVVDIWHLEYGWLRLLSLAILDLSLFFAFRFFFFR